MQGRMDGSAARYSRFPLTDGRKLRVSQKIKGFRKRFSTSNGRKKTERLTERPSYGGLQKLDGKKSF